MITEDYVSFKTAKLLKEKGFDLSEFLGKWAIDYDNIPQDVDDSDGEIIVAEWHYPLITLQMAMKWLRELHDCVICITPLTFYCGEIVSKWGYCIWADDNTEVDEESSPRLESYEEACEAAIKYCLENLV